MSWLAIEASIDTLKTNLARVWAAMAKPQEATVTRPPTHSEIDEQRAEWEGMTRSDPGQEPD